MSCFCTTALGPLGLALPGLSVSAALNLSATATAAMRLDAFLTARAGLMGLNMGWPALALPRISLSANAMMNVALMAQLRAQLMARLGLDLMIPRQATAFLRMAATLNARMPPMPSLNLLAWLQLGQFNAALLRIQAAITAGAFASVNLSASLTLAAGFGPFFAALTPLSIMLTAMAQLNVTSVAALTASLTAMASLSLPVLPPLTISAMANLSAGLSAVAGLGLAFNCNPLQLGFPAIRAMVGANLTATLSALASIGITLSASLSASLAAGMPAFPIPSFAISAVVSAAMSLNVSAMASLNLTLSAGMMSALTVSALAINLSAALSISASLSPCGVCDAAAQLAALLTA